MKEEKMTKKTMVSSVTAFVLFLVINWAAVQARQVLLNENMDGCNVSSFGRLTDWSGDFGGFGFPLSLPPSVGNNLDDTSCAAAWIRISTPTTQTLALNPVTEAPGLYDFQARFACTSTGTPGTCTFILIIDGQPITLTGDPVKSASTNTDTYRTLTATGITINNPNAVVSLDCDVTGFAGQLTCFVTQATLTFDSLVAGDPHVIGLDGQRFDIQGESGSAFNILSDFDVQVCVFVFLFLFSTLFLQTSCPTHSPNDPPSFLHLLCR